MTTCRYLQLDVFAARVGGGNPLGVVVDAADWNSDQMQAFARWTNLVETTYLLPPTEPTASYRVRIFTPTKEIPFAGHPSIGSAHAALECGLVTPVNGQLVQQCAAGLLGVRVLGTGAEQELLVQAPAARVISSGLDDQPELASLLQGIPLGPLQPAFVEGGRRWWLAEFRDEAALRNWQPEHARIAAIAQADDCLGLCVFARSNNADYELAVRAFPAGVGIVEDPASGAANGLIAAYIAQAEPNGTLARGYRVSQGREMGHDAAIRIDFVDGMVWVGGRTNTIISGETRWL